jgi:hypothetical protein
MLPVTYGARSLIVGLQLDHCTAAQLRGIYGYAFTDASEVDDVISAVELGRVGALIVGARQSADVSLAVLIRRVRESRSDMPILIYSDPGPEALRQVLRFGRAGATDVVVRGVDDTPEVWRRFINVWPSSRLSDEILAALAGLLDSRLVLPAKFCLDHAADVDTTSLCFALGVSLRTLSRWAARGGVGGARALITKCKAAVAIGLAVKLDYTVEAAACATGFSSGAHLANTVKRLTVFTVSNIRASPDLGRWWRGLFCFLT